MESDSSSAESWEKAFVRLEELLAGDRQEIGKMRKLVAVIGAIASFAPPSPEMETIKKLIDDACGELGVIREDGPESIALTTGSEHSVPNELPVLDECRAGGTRLGEPTSEERCPRRGTVLTVVRIDHCERYRCEI